MTRRKKKCERYGEEEDDDDDDDCACEQVKKEKMETVKSEHIDQSLGGTRQEGSHQMAGDNHTGVNGTMTSKDTMQGLVSLPT